MIHEDQKAEYFIDMMPDAISAQFGFGRHHRSVSLIG